VNTSNINKESLKLNRFAKLCTFVALKNKHYETTMIKNQMHNMIIFHGSYMCYH